MNFDREVVGLGIVAAMSNSNDLFDAIVSAKSSRTAILSLLPKWNPVIPMVRLCTKPKFINHIDEDDDDMELSECYTCVISNIGNNVIKRREYFDDIIVNMMNPVQTSDFLESCYLCNKMLKGLDIFIYGGEKAFCSAECRYQQIMNDEHKEKCGSETIDCSVCRCSDKMQFFTGVAAA